MLTTVSWPSLRSSVLCVRIGSLWFPYFSGTSGHRMILYHVVIQNAYSQVFIEKSVFVIT